MKRLERCHLLSLGLVEYGKAWGMQKDLFQARSRNEIIDTLILLQHPPTYTFGRRSQPGQQVLEKQVLEKKDSTETAIYWVDRGGGATYHGPGQIVGYPIIGLKSYTSDFHTYLRMLEDVMIGTLAEFNITSQRLKGYTGVWGDGEKIGSIGVRIIKGVTMHGFSLNINNDLAPFDKIVPCNIQGVEMTSMSKIVGTTLNISEVEKSLIDNFSIVFDVTIHPTSSFFSMAKCCALDAW